MKPTKQRVIDLCLQYKLHCHEVINEEGNLINDCVGIIGITAQDILEAIQNELGGKIVLFSDNSTELLKLVGSFEKLEHSAAELQFEGFLAKGILIFTASENSTS